MLYQAKYYEVDNIIDVIEKECKLETVNTEIKYVILIKTHNFLVFNKDIKEYRNVEHEELILSRDMQRIWRRDRRN